MGGLCLPLLLLLDGPPSALGVGLRHVAGEGVPTLEGLPAQRTVVGVLPPEMDRLEMITDLEITFIAKYFK